MAKTRAKRRSFKPARRPADWVYRTDTRDAAGILVDTLGAYSPNTKALVGGPAGAQIAMLYDSSNFTKQAVGPANIPQFQTRASRAEGRQALIRMVEGVVQVVPSAWAAGSTFQLGWRFGKWTQAPDTGAVFLDPEYTMFVETIDQSDSPANWANSRDWQKEGRTLQFFLENRSSWELRFRFRVNRTLDPWQCYAAYFESTAASVNLNLRCWLRCLVSDTG